MKEALFYEKLKGGKVRCMLCPHSCLIADGRRGICGVRENMEGALFSLVYGKVIAIHIDPIEKKPFYHFYPGSRALSVATAGCNLSCSFCQNFDISQVSKGSSRKIPGEELSPADIVDLAARNSCRSISFTYSEPTIFFEFAYDTARLARGRGIKTNFVTNGFTSIEPIRQIAPFLDSANVDIKSFSEDFYKKVCGARLKPVLDTVREMKKLGIWVEITTLVVPGENDSDSELDGIASFIASIDKGMPWHLSRFHPDYKLLDSEPTPMGTLERAYEIGKKAGLRFVYVGNAWGNRHDNTYCPKCGSELISREGFSVTSNTLEKGCCRDCREKIDGFFS